jgi:CubicO group peptidase (beta-lactamase class C family)
LDDVLAGPTVDAFIVVHRGRIVYERYPHMRPQDKHVYWSVSKSFVGAIVAMLEDEGRVDSRAPIEKYIGELAPTAWAGTPVIDILDMASGMSGLEVDDRPAAYTDPASVYYQFEARLGLHAKAAGPETDAYAYVAGLKRLKPSGRVKEYSSVNTFVLSWLIEKVTGKPYPEVVSERIWRRIGAEADAGMVVDRATGTPWSHGGMFSTLRDLARFGLLYTPSWRTVSREPVISAAHLRKIQTGGRPELLDNRKKEYSDKPVYSGEYVSTYQWDFVWPDGDFLKLGFQGQGLYVSPLRNLVMACFSSGRGLACTSSHFRALAESGVFGK